MYVLVLVCHKCLLLPSLPDPKSQPKRDFWRISDTNDAIQLSLVCNNTKDADFVCSFVPREDNWYFIKPEWWIAPSGIFGVCAYKGDASAWLSLELSVAGSRGQRAFGNASHELIGSPLAFEQAARLWSHWEWMIDALLENTARCPPQLKVAFKEAVCKRFFMKWKPWVAQLRVLFCTWMEMCDAA